MIAKLKICLLDRRELRRQICGYCVAAGITRKRWSSPSLEWHHSAWETTQGELAVDPKLSKYYIFGIFTVRWWYYGATVTRLYALKCVRCSRVYIVKGKVAILLYPFLDHSPLRRRNSPSKVHIPVTAPRLMAFRYSWILAVPVFTF